MIQLSKTFIRAGSLLVATAIGLVLQAQPSGLWNFENGNLAGTPGAALDYVDGAGSTTSQQTKFGTTTSFGIPDIGGAPARVMQFGAFTAPQGYLIPTPGAPNGGGTLVNNWTLILDILYPPASDGKLRAIIETDGGTINQDSDLFVGPTGGLGVAGKFDGKMAPNTWYRIGFVVNGEEKMIHKFIDGVEVGKQGTDTVDGRWALLPNSPTYFLNDDNGEVAGGYVSSIQMRGEALSAGQMRALAGPVASGIPVTLPPVPSGVVQWIPGGEFSSRSTTIGAVIDPGSTTIADSSISLKLNGQALASPSITRAAGLITVRTASPQTLNPTTKYTIEVTLTDSLAGQKKATREFTAALFYEDFEGLPLMPNKEEAAAFEKAFTHTPPADWSIDNSKFPAVVISAENPDDDGDGYADLDGRSEWAGWSFANKDFWIASDNQTRDQFSLGQGTLAIADPDEWDDLAHAVSLYNSFLKTPVIALDGIAPGSAFLKFASSWRPEGFDDSNVTKFPVGPNGEAINNQTAIITVSYDGATPVQVFKYDSKQGSPTFKPDAQNESVLLQLNNPAGAKSMVLSFEMRDAANDWWWAVDNIVINAGSSPPIITKQPAAVEANEGTPAALSAVVAGDGLKYQWFKGQGSGRTAVAGATGPSLDFAKARIEDTGYYSLDIVNGAGTATSAPVKFTVLPSTTGRLVLLNENFDSLPLGPNIEEGITTGSGGPKEKVWTKTGPSGWTIDDTGVPGVGTAGDGVTEWAGWSFADRAWWAETTGDQQRTGFTKGTGASAIADSDEWDDIGHDAGNMATYLKTAPIALDGVKPNSVIFKFDSSWRPESPQKASIKASFDGGTPVDVLLYSSDTNDPNFRGDEVNETIAVRINNPAGAKAMTLTFGYFDTRNNWWWAVDNLLVVGDPSANQLYFEGFNSVALGPNVEEGIATGSGGAQPNVWSKTPPAGWAIDDSGVPGAGTDNDGVREWAGWSFADRAWWASTAGDQRRTEFLKGTGAIAIADGDEWDDLPRAAGKMNTFLSTPALNITGQPADSVVLKFDSSWRDEPDQAVNVTASFDGGAAVEVMRWESIEGGPNFHNDEPNESVTVALHNPAGAKSVVLTFGYLNAGNNWWWAIDNIELQGGAPAAPAMATIPFSENFDGLELGPNVEEGISTGSGGAKANVWTKTPPPGWMIDDSGVPGAGTDNDGVREWAGWSFADRAWWASTAGDQRRTEFLKGTGAIAIADGDEWDDLPREAGKMNTFLMSPMINIAGLAANSLALTFDSSWRDEPDQAVNITASFDGGAPVEVMRWESIEGGPNFHNDAPNETVMVPLSNPAGATSMVFTFGYLNAGNNWWWAIDNIVVDVAKPQSNIGISQAGGQITISWQAGGVLQSADLITGPWTNVAGASSPFSATPTGPGKFFRVLP